MAFTADEQDVLREMVANKVARSDDRGLLDFLILVRTETEPQLRVRLASYAAGRVQAIDPRIAEALAQRNLYASVAGLPPI